MTDDLHSFLNRFQDLFAAGLLSVFGGTAAYVYKTVRDDTGFKFSQFFINAFLAFFVGNVVGGLIPEHASYRDGILMLAGFSAWPLLGIFEFYGKKVVSKYLDASLGTNLSNQVPADKGDKTPEAK